MKKIINIIAPIAIAVVFVIVPLHAFAATVYLEASRSTVSVGDTAVVTVKINADGSVLNTVDGEVTLKSSSLNLAVQEFSLANSAFGLWPRTPSLSKDLKTISFVGGVPGGFSIEGATIFKIIVEAKKAGVVTINPQNISVFANDGKGTKLPVQFKNITITVTPKLQGTAIQNDWSGVVTADTVPPEDFVIVLGQEPTLFDGKKFAFFSAIDNQSGIDYYDVSENGGVAVRSGSTYVLKDQSDSVRLQVTAYDKAGNKKIALHQSQSRGVNWLGIIIIVLVVLIVRFMYKKWKKNKLNV
ncbi:MAG: hypothetical protein PHG25_01335 [Candidatus Pacebacteria bacterium]|nr:hypothetical protein [Candidatus Paceibacterota bacterium]